MPDQDVLGLDVAVHDAGPVGGGEPGQHRLEDGEGLGDGQPAAGLQQVAQRAAADELHDQEDQALVAALVADADDVGVAEHGRGPGLAGEPVDERRVVREVLGHDLDGDGPVQPQIGRGVDGGHAATGEPLLEAVAPLEDQPHHGVGHGCVHGAECRSAIGGARPSNHAVKGRSAGAVVAKLSGARRHAGSAACDQPRSRPG